MAATNLGSTVNGNKAVQARQNAMDKCHTNPTSNNYITIKTIMDVKAKTYKVKKIRRTCGMNKYQN